MNNHNIKLRYRILRVYVWDIALSHASKTNYFVFQICVRCVRYRIIGIAAHVGQLYYFK